MKGFLRRLAAVAAVVLLLPAAAEAQPVTFDVNAPRVVAVGEIFRVEYVADGEPEGFDAPAFEGVDVLAGPTLSTSKSISIVNGNMTKETRYTYTYVLQGNAEGEIELPAARITVKGKSYSAGPVRIQVLNVTGSAGAGGASVPAAGSQSSERAVLVPDDIVVRAEVDKRTVYKGEPVRVTYKLYRRVPLNLENAKFPSYDGFWAQQLNVDGYAPQREELNGKIYDAHVIREDLLFPQQAGTLTIDPLELSVVAQIVMQSRRQSLIDGFFGGPNIQEVRRRVASKPVTITVRDLPAGAPASFSGAVGDFSLEAVNPTSQVAANSAFTLTLKLSGSGNLPQVQAPKLELPASFEQYNVKTTESLNNTAQGIYGYRQFEYPAIARVAGEYDLPPVEFTYFNPRQRTYETLRVPGGRLTVLPDSTNVAANGPVLGGVSKEEIQILGRDIRFIHLDDPHLRRSGRLFFASGWYFLGVALLLAAFAGAYVWLRKVLRDRSNSVLVKGKRANKVALLRFRAAERHMNDNNPRGFYEEMLKALWGYMGDKLNIPASNLTKENVRDELLKRGISAETAQRYIAIIGECEYAQYAPAVTGRMNELYTAGVEIVSKLEGIIGK